MSLYYFLMCKKTIEANQIFIDEGFVNGKWVKGETTAKNERRLFLEMKKEKLNYKEDGIAQIKYDLVSKEQISDNAWMINVKL